MKSLYPSAPHLFACLWLAFAPFALGTPQALTAEKDEDRVVISIAGEIFTVYEHGAELKYPQFYPVVGPRTGQSVTTRRTPPFPHHSSLFFACDHVNGGNFWQDRLERGQIVAKETSVRRAAGREVELEQVCLWVRPDAPSPFSDRRLIRVSAPSPDLRIIDFDITLTALVDVTINRNNHSLFSARMAPDLAVTGGGSLIDQTGRSAETETLGQTAGWMDARGPRGEAIEGLAIFDHPGNHWAPTPWFTRNYGFFSPTPLQWIEAPFRMAEGESLRLRYRVIVHGHNPDPAEVERLYQEWISQDDTAALSPKERTTARQRKFARR